MEIKLLCDCGQKFKFDVEPVNGLMPFAINCPFCGIDGTAAANALLAPVAPAPPPMPGVLHISRPEAAPVSVAEAAPAFATRPAPITAPARPLPKKTGEFNLGLGIVGALVGAGVGAGAMYAFYSWVGFRFPLLGIGIGALTGFGAKTLARGTENTLGIISGAIALVAVVATLYLMYGTFPILSIISVVVSASMAYRIASG
jgi:hypothetical protein